MLRKDEKPKSVPLWKFWMAVSVATVLLVLDVYKRQDEDMAELEARRYDKTEDPSRPWTVVKNVNGKDIYNYYGNYDWWNTVFNSHQPSQSCLLYTSRCV